MSMRIAAALLVALLGFVACEDDGASVRDLGGSASSGSGSGSGSGTGVASGSGTEASGTEPASECEEPDLADPALTVKMDEYEIEVEEDELTSGPTRFRVMNVGEDEHELVVVASKQVEGLPLDRKGFVDEEALDPGDLITEVEGIAAGDACAVEIDFEPGTYVLFCNIRERSDEGVVNHFLQGMRARVKVL